MDKNEINRMANLLISETYGSTDIPPMGSVIVRDSTATYKVFFEKHETGWVIIKTLKI